MGVIAAAPRPTFNNPFNTNLAMQAPAVPPGFMTYAQATGAPAYAGSSGGAVVLRPPAGGNEPQMAAMPSAPTEPTNPAPLPTTTETANQGTAEPAPAPQSTETQSTETQTAALPKSTTTQSGGATAGNAAPAGTATAGAETPPSQPEQVPATVPSPVQPGDTVANVAQAPTPPAAGTENQAATAPATNTQSTEPTTNTQTVESQNPTTNTQTTTSNTQSTEAQNATPPAQPSTEQQAATTPPAPATEGGNAAPNSGGALPAGANRILYTGESDDVPSTANGDLDKVASAMQSDQNMRVQILAYAAGTEDTESKARRKSLARGLAIRSYLIKAGVPSTRIDVRALGSKADGGPADRVDIVPAT
jgi:outer membrane protein OmpA-like peptidoglycan-associated protein